MRQKCIDGWANEENTAEFPSNREPASQLSLFEKLDKHFVNFIDQWITDPGTKLRNICSP